MRIKYLQMVTDKDLVVCEQVDGDAEVMMLVEEINILDNDEIENEVTELEFEKDKGMNDGTIEKTYLGLLKRAFQILLSSFYPWKKCKALFGNFLDSLHIPVSA